MQRLIAGYSRFRKDVYPHRRSLFQQLASKQTPEALFITCSDSRIVPDLITQSEPGDLFICRNAGNIVPAYGEVNGGVSATIEYAVQVLKVRSIIVCGHSDCGAMKGVLHPGTVQEMRTVASWLRHADTARQVVETNYGPMDEARTLRALTEENVIAQLQNLRTHPAVAAKIAAGSLQIFGWLYEIHTGEVRSYEPEEKRFVPLESQTLAITEPRQSLQSVS